MTDTDADGFGPEIRPNNSGLGSTLTRQLDAIGPERSWSTMHRTLDVWNLSRAKPLFPTNLISQLSPVKDLQLVPTLKGPTAWMKLRIGDSMGLPFLDTVGPTAAKWSPRIWKGELSPKKAHSVQSG